MTDANDQAFEVAYNYNELQKKIQKKIKQNNNLDTEDELINFIKSLESEADFEKLIITDEQISNLKNECSFQKEEQKKKVNKEFAINYALYLTANHENISALNYFIKKKKANPDCNSYLTKGESPIEILIEGIEEFEFKTLKKRNDTIRLLLAQGASYLLEDQFVNLLILANNTATEILEKKKDGLKCNEERLKLSLYSEMILNIGSVLKPEKIDDIIEKYPSHSKELVGKYVIDLIKEISDEKAKEYLELEIKGNDERLPYSSDAVDYTLYKPRIEQMLNKDIYSKMGKQPRSQ